jgi:hypothetical protein
MVLRNPSFDTPFTPVPKREKNKRNGRRIKESSISRLTRIWGGCYHITCPIKNAASCGNACLEQGVRACKGSEKMKQLVCQKFEDEVIEHRGYLQGILKQKENAKRKR